MRSFSQEIESLVGFLSVLAELGFLIFIRIKLGQFFDKRAQKKQIREGKHGLGELSIIEPKRSRGRRVRK